VTIRYRQTIAATTRLYSTAALLLPSLAQPGPTWRDFDVTGAIFLFTRVNTLLKVAFVVLLFALMLVNIIIGNKKIFTCMYFTKGSSYDNDYDWLKTVVIYQEGCNRIRCRYRQQCGLSLVQVLLATKTCQLTLLCQHVWRLPRCLSKATDDTWVCFLMISTQSWQNRKHVDMWCRLNDVAETSATLTASLLI